MARIQKASKNLFAFSVLWLLGGVVVSTAFQLFSDKLPSAIYYPTVLSGVAVLALWWISTRAKVSKKSSDSLSDRMLAAAEEYARYAERIVAEIDLKECSENKRVELGHALKKWRSQHLEIASVQGQDELLRGEYPPFVPSGPVEVVDGVLQVLPNEDCPVIVMSDEAYSSEVKQSLIDSLKSSIPRDTISRISVGQAFRGY